MSLPTPIPSACVVITRDGASALEILLVRRNAKIAFYGGAWVFPGGKVDAADAIADDDEFAVAKRAALREAHEETGLALDGDRLAVFSHWTTPEDQPKRFATWVFLAATAGEHAVQIDNSEIVDFKWIDIEGALALQAANEIMLPAPTFVTLLKLRTSPNTGAIAAYAAEVEHFVPRIVELEDGRCSLYAEDAGYDTLDLNAPGARHRLLMLESGWLYQNTLEAGSASAG